MTSGPTSSRWVVGPTDQAAADWVDNVRAGSPPFMPLHDTKDRLATYVQGEQLADHVLPNTVSADQTGVQPE